MAIPVGSIIGLGLRVVANREKIAEVWDKIVPLIRDIRGNDPMLGDLFARLRPPEGNEPEPPKMDVRWLQDSLNKLGAKLEVDGAYGDATKEAVKQFQRAHGLEVDGWAGVNTQAAILEELAQRRA